MSTFRGLLTDFSGPSALDLLTEFRKKHITLAERRSTELRAAIESAIDADRDRMLREGKDGYDHAPHIREMINEYDSLRYFEQELNRLITAFANEARQPLIDLLCRIEPWNTSTVTRPSMESLAQGIRPDAAAGNDSI